MVLAQSSCRKDKRHARYSKCGDGLFVHIVFDRDQRLLPIRRICRSGGALAAGRGEGGSSRRPIHLLECDIIGEVPFQSRQAILALQQAVECTRQLAIGSGYFNWMEQIPNAPDAKQKYTSSTLQRLWPSSTEVTWTPHSYTKSCSHGLTKSCWPVI